MPGRSPRAARRAPAAPHRAVGVGPRSRCGAAAALRPDCAAEPLRPAPPTSASLAASTLDLERRPRRPSASSFALGLRAYSLRFRCSSRSSSLRVASSVPRLGAQRLSRRSRSTAPSASTCVARCSSSARRVAERRRVGRPLRWRRPAARSARPRWRVAAARSRADARRASSPASRVTFSSACSDPPRRAAGSAPWPCSPISPVQARAAPPSRRRSSVAQARP